MTNIVLRAAYISDALWISNALYYHIQRGACKYTKYYMIHYHFAWLISVMSDDMIAELSYQRTKGALIDRKLLSQKLLTTAPRTLPSFSRSRIKHNLIRRGMDFFSIIGKHLWNFVMCVRKFRRKRVGTVIR